MDDMACLRNQVLGKSSFPFSHITFDTDIEPANAEVAYPKNVHQKLIVRQVLAETGHAKRPVQWIATLVSLRPDGKLQKMVDSVESRTIKGAYTNLLEHTGEALSADLLKLVE